MSKDNVKAIAVRMKALREICDTSVDDLCSTLDIDKDTYTAYEAGEQDIPIGFLYTFANHFNVELTAILTGEEPKLKKYSLVKSNEGLKIERNSAYDYRDLAYNFTDKKAEVFLVTVPAAGSTSSLSTHSGQEINYVLEGKLLVHIEGHDVEIGAGDCLYFDSSKPHSMIAMDGKDAKMLVTIIA